MHACMTRHGRVMQASCARASACKIMRGRHRSNGIDTAGWHAVMDGLAAAAAVTSLNGVDGLGGLSGGGQAEAALANKGLEEKEAAVMVARLLRRSVGTLARLDLRCCLFLPDPRRLCTCAFGSHVPIADSILRLHTRTIDIHRPLESRSSAGAGPACWILGSARPARRRTAGRADGRAGGGEGGRAAGHGFTRRLDIGRGPGLGLVFYHGCLTLVFDHGSKGARFSGRSRASVPCGCLGSRAPPDASSAKRAGRGWRTRLCTRRRIGLRWSCGFVTRDVTYMRMRNQE